MISRRDQYISDGAKLLIAVARGELRPEEVAPAQERLIVSASRERVQERVARIEAKLLHGAFRAARREADDLRRCLAGRFLALWSSLPAFMKDRLEVLPDFHGELRVERWRLLTVGLEVIGKLDRPARAELYAKRKGSGDHADRCYRPIFRFEWIDQARQRLIRLSLSPFVDFHPSQHLLRQSPDGRGRSAVLEALLRELPQMGTEHVFVQLDVQNFYSSISHAWLEENLPLAKGITRAQVHTGGMAIVPTGKNVRARLPGGAVEHLGRRGIPPGSALSALVGEYVIAEVLRGLADCLNRPLLHAFSHNLRTYSDNLGVFVDRAQTDAVVDLLQRAFASSAAGPFSLRAASPKPLSEPFQFLGYWFRLEGREAEAFVPPVVAKRRMDAILRDLMTADLERLRKLRITVAGVAADWRYWQGVRAWERFALQRVALAEEALGGRTT